MAFNIVTDNERAREWVKASGEGAGTDLTVTIALERDGEITAVVGFNNFTDHACHVHFIVQKGAYINRELLWFAWYYPFVQLNLKCVICMLEMTNKAIIKLANKVGFKLKTILDDAQIMLFTVTKEDYRYGK